MVSDHRGVNMPYKYKRDCPICYKPGLQFISDHLRQVHHLYGDERKKWLSLAPFSQSKVQSATAKISSFPSPYPVGIRPKN